MSNNLSHVLRVATCVFVVTFVATAHASDQLDRVQRAVAELKGQLAISQAVDVKIVRTNPRLFSVEPVAHDETFLLSVEEDFAQALTDAELRAAVAHELGHVWIYTHFPYLQTEELANDIASRAVSRDMLAPLYDKVWKKAGR
jgi:predicted Zn-dependent protease